MVKKLEKQLEFDFMKKICRKGEILKFKEDMKMIYGLHFKFIKDVLVLSGIIIGGVGASYGIYKGIEYTINYFK